MINKYFILQHIRQHSIVKITMESKWMHSQSKIYIIAFSDCCLLACYIYTNPNFSMYVSNLPKFYRLVFPNLQRT